MTKDMNAMTPDELEYIVLFALPADADDYSPSAVLCALEAVNELARRAEEMDLALMLERGEQDGATHDGWWFDEEARCWFRWCSARQLYVSARSYGWGCGLYGGAPASNMRAAMVAADKWLATVEGRTTAG